jgi:hypothetical protein
MPPTHLTKRYCFLAFLSLTALNCTSKKSTHAELFKPFDRKFSIEKFSAVDTVVTLREVETPVVVVADDSKLYIADFYNPIIEIVDCKEYPEESCKSVDVIRFNVGKGKHEITDINAMALLNGNLLINDANQFKMLIYNPDKKTVLREIKYEVRMLEYIEMNDSTIFFQSFGNSSLYNMMNINTGKQVQCELKNFAPMPDPVVDAMALPSNLDIIPWKSNADTLYVFESSARSSHFSVLKIYGSIVEQVFRGMNADAVDYFRSNLSVQGGVKRMSSSSPFSNSAKVSSNKEFFLTTTNYKSKTSVLDFYDADLSYKDSFDASSCFPVLSIAVLNKSYFLFNGSIYVTAVSRN